MSRMAEMTEAEIQSDRRNFIGGSDAAAVLGMSRYKTPLQLWAEKTGNIIPEDASHKLPVRIGNRLEEVVAQLFTEETGKAVRRVSEHKVHPDYPYIRAQIDRRILGADEILECKTASGWKAKEWDGDEIPPEYIIQCYHQLAVTGKERAHIACLIGGNQDFVYKVVERDEAVIKELVDREVEFWTRFVVPGVMPAVSAADATTLFGLFPSSNEEGPVEIPAAEQTIEAIRAVEEQMDALEKERETYRNELRALLGEHATGIAGRFKVTWKPQSTTRLDTDRIKSEAPEIYTRFAKTTESRILRISENKPKKETTK